MTDTDFDLNLQFEEWLDAHGEIVNMEAEDIALKAWRAGVTAAQHHMHGTPLTLFGLPVEIATWLKPGQWFLRPSRRP
jgi:hypothetical protein